MLCRTVYCSSLVVKVPLYFQMAAMLCILLVISLRSQRECQIDAVSVGAIASDYQRLRVEHV